MSGADGALQLRFLQTLNAIAAENNSTIVFPLPIELMRGIMGRTDSSGNSEEA
jgi:erythrocyte band 7 integral membrane protein